MKYWYFVVASMYLLICFLSLLTVLISKKIEIRLRAIVVFSLLGILSWKLTELLGNIDWSLALLMNRLNTLAAALSLLVLSVLLKRWFSVEGGSLIAQIVTLATAFNTLVVIALFNSPLFLPALKPRFPESWGHDLVKGGAYWVVETCFVISCLLLSGWLLRIIKRTTSRKAYLASIKVLLSFASMFLINIYLVSVNNSLLNEIIGLTITGVFCITLMYCMIKYGFLDVKFATFRAIAYFISFGGVCLMLGLLFVAGYQITSGVSGSDTTNSIALLGLMLLSGLFFEPMRKRFNRMTNRLFFRDGYDAGDLIATITEGLARQTKTSGAFAFVAETLEKSFFYSFLQFKVHRPDGSKRTYRYGKAAANDLDDFFNGYNYVESELTAVTTNPTVARVIGKEFRSVGDCLAVGFENRVENSTYRIEIIVGPKNINDLFTSDDVKVMRALVQELKIVLQNTLNIDRIKKFNTELEAKIDQATKALRERNKRLSLYDTAKSELISMVAHQLKPQLNASFGLVEMLEQEQKNKSGEDHETMRVLLQTNFRMSHIVNGMLSLTQIEDGRLKVNKEPGSMSDLLDDSIRSVKMIRSEKKIRVDVKVAGSVRLVPIDAQKLKEAVINLLDNAIIYGGENGRILVKIEFLASSCRVIVRDFGPGISKENLRKISQKFARTEDSRVINPLGTGIGLFTAKRIVESHGGKLIIKSEPGVGSDFGFEIPL